MAEFFAHGKLMLTGEYFVLDGAKSLAFPTKKGQGLEFNSCSKELAERSRSQVRWKSFDHLGNIWFETKIDCQSLSLSKKNQIGLKLEQILRKARELNPAFLHEGGEVDVKAHFDLQWGFGSSSTLISLIAQWAKVDAYSLQFACFGGSGYDIACATAKGPIVYQKLPKPRHIEVDFNPDFKDVLYLVYLGQKQNSRAGIEHYKSLEITKKQDIIYQLNHITDSILENQSFENFCQLLQEHENIISKSLKLATVQETLFPDFNGQIKSLGAWGGDFVLAASQMLETELVNYFDIKGYTTILKWEETILF